MNETNNGMIREDKNEKLNFLSYFTPYTLLRYAKHMKNGEKKHGRSNWKKGGYSKEEYLESLVRHALGLWFENSYTKEEQELIMSLLGLPTKEGEEIPEDNAAAVIFNAVGYMNEEEIIHRSTKENSSSGDIVME